MAMKESVRSMSAYFIIVGIWSGFVNVISIIKSQGNLLAIVIGACFIVLSLSYLLIGIRLRSVLLSKPATITWVLMASIIVLIVNLATSLTAMATHHIIGSVVGFLIVFYLLVNVRRLSREEQAKAGQEAAIPPSEPSPDV